MKILINASNLKVGGGKQVFLSFLTELYNKGYLENKNFSFYFYMHESLIDEIDNEIINCIELRHQYSVNSNLGLPYFFSMRADLKRIDSKFIPDKVFTVFGPAYWKPKRAKHIVGFALPWMIYTESPIYKELSKYEFIKKIVFNKIRAHLLKREGDEFVVETDSVKFRLSKLLNINNKLIHTVPNCVSSRFYNYANSKEETDLSVSKYLVTGENKIKVLMLSAFYNHKNFNLIKRAVSDERFSQFHFFITISNEDYCKNFEDSATLTNLGPVSAEICPALYNETDIVIQPSLLECFSANYVEAMYMNKPLVLSDFEFSRTTVRDNGYYFEHDDLNALLSALLIARKEPVTTKEYVKENFPNAKERAMRYINIVVES
ncbi:glycosyltransferase [Photobacterium leiognathi]|uniref:glycosyltransferase n=1 Tax=Photobacterium leiognathi TaxID=553611 RepID=UPI002736E2F3|nr:glycosyltransferase [Photobacterium leiognathi]